VDAAPPRKRHAADVDEFERRIAFRLPATDHADFPLPDGVPFVRGPCSLRRFLLFFDTYYMIVCY
jgi:hypothetical protein